MTYFEALYGSQYYEITSKGRNGAAGRLNGNLFFSAFIIICIFLIMIILTTISDDFTNGMNRMFHKMFGYSSGKFVGKLLAFPLIIIIYFIISKTVGSRANYEKYTKSFMEYSVEEKQKANKKILFPFLGVLALLLVFILIKSV